MKLDTSVI